MPHELDLAEIAGRQLADYYAHRPGRFFLDAPSPLTIAQAYEVQNLVASRRAARGESIAGYKIGCVSEVVQRQLGIHRPVFGHLFATEFHPSGVTLDPAAFENLAIEGEFAVRIAEDIPDPDWLARHPERVVAEVVAVIELHNNVFRGSTRTAQELIANNAIHAGVVRPSTGDRRNRMTSRSPFFATGSCWELRRPARFPAACSDRCSASQCTSPRRAAR